MKQLAQRLKDGELRVVEVPAPELDDWAVLVRTYASLVSAGTERAKVEVARESLLGKARRRPDQVRQVLDKARADGIAATVDAVRGRLEALQPLGYCAAGRVLAVGAHVRDVAVGDLVTCGGEEAAHAELLAVPGNLCVRVPEAVSPESAAFATLGSIAMHGFRQADVRLGDRLAIVGLGLVGQLAARIARAAGCHVTGIDLEEWRLEVARRAGAVDDARRRDRISADDHGAYDAVLVTAAAPTSNDPVSLATDLVRERGCVVIVGDVRLDLDRRRLYAKEVEVRMARSYGPGRYDVEYEQRGLDYPLSYVRWTERRNMSEFVRLLADGRIGIDDLITHRYSIDEADHAHQVLTSRDERALAVVIEYRHDGPAPEPAVAAVAPGFSPGPRVGFVGAGSFAQRILIPLAKRHGLVLDRVATASGLSATSAAERFGFERGAATVDELLADRSLAGVVVATRHDRHASLTLAALRAGKAVLVEKPLCLTTSELDEVRAEVERPGAPPLFVGFNRRFAPATAAVRSHLAGVDGATTVLVRVNAGPLPADHWLNDVAVGGGRLLGEGCHFLDLIAYLVPSEAVAVQTTADVAAGAPVQAAQDFTIVVRFADGSLGTLVYGTRGASAVGKEVVEASRGDRTARIDDFRSTTLWGGGRMRTEKTRGQDKGHSPEVLAFARAVRGDDGRDGDGARQSLASTALTLAALRSLELGAEVRLAGASDEREPPPCAESAEP